MRVKTDYISLFLVLADEPQYIDETFRFVPNKVYMKNKFTPILLPD